MSWNYHWRSHPSAAQLEQAIDQLRMANIQLRRQLTTKTNLANGLKLALQQRHETIDALNGKLDEEAECYAAMVQRAPLRERY
jgi:hypothetical protein